MRFSVRIYNINGDLMDDFLGAQLDRETATAYGRSWLGDLLFGEEITAFELYSD